MRGVRIIQRRRAVDKRFYYLFFLMLTYFILELYYKIHVESLGLKVILYAIYYGIAYFGVQSFFITDRPKGYILIFTILIGIGLSFEPLIALPIFLMSFSIYAPQYSIMTKIVGSLLIVVFFFTFAIGVIFSENGLFPLKIPVEVTERVANEDGSYNYIVEFIDEGALGASEILYIEKELPFGIQIWKRQRLLGRNREIKWIDRNTLRVNKEDIHVTIWPR